MTSSITFFQNWKAVVDEAILRTATVKLTLHTSTYTPNAATQAVYADLTNELPTANGYTNGGLALTGTSWTQSAGTAAYKASNAVWTVSTANLVFRYGVLRVTGTINAQVDPLIAYILGDTTPADITTTPGNTLTFAWNASGIFTLA